MFRRINSDTKTRITTSPTLQSQLARNSRSPNQFQNQYHYQQKAQNYEFNDPNKYRVSNISTKMQMKSVSDSKIQSSNLIQLYKKENENLKEQNEYLLEKLRKYKENELNLIRYIKQIESGQCEENSNIDTQESHIQHRIEVKMPGRNPQSVKKIMTKSKSGDFFNKQNNNSNLAQFQDESSIQDLYALNHQFCKQMKQVSKQTNPEKRKLLRQQMAKLANQMKCIRENMKK